MKLKNWFLAGVIVGALVSYYYVVRVKATPFQEPVGIPVKLTIPALRVDAPVEQVGVDADGRMSVPKNIYGTGWYDMGAKPGEPGNAVIDGHVNTPQLKPSVFANLAGMRKGDTIQIEDSNKRIRTFEVYSVQNIPSAHFPIETVFGSSGERNLVLITCSGYYQKNKNDYSSRTVVFSRLLN